MEELSHLEDFTEIVKQRERFDGLEDKESL